VHPDCVANQFLLRTIEIELQLTEIQLMCFRLLNESGGFIDNGRRGQIVFKKRSRVRLNAQKQGRPASLSS
jgi:hypothetical protein